MTTRPDISSTPLTYEHAKKVFLAEYLERVLYHAGGRVVHAAKIAGIDRTHFYELLHRTGMSREILAKVRDQI